MKRNVGWIGWLVAVVACGGRTLEPDFSLASGGLGGSSTGDVAGGAGPVGPTGGSSGIGGAGATGAAGGTIAAGGVAGTAGGSGAPDCSTGARGCPCTVDSECATGLACTSELGCTTLCSVGYTKLETQADVEALAARECVVIDGTVHFYGSGITSLAGLETVRVVRGGVAIDTTSLSNVSGLDGLEEAQAVSISQNPALNDLGALAKLTRIVSDGVPALVIYGNPALVDLHGLSGVQEFDGQLVIADNDQLQTTGWLTVRSSQAVTISSNPELTSLSGLDSLETAGSITITANAKLQEIHLEFLRSAHDIFIAANDSVWWASFIDLGSVDSNFVIAANGSLRIAELLGLATVGGKLTISGNASLETMDLARLTSVGSLEISGNPLFAQCVVDQLGARLNACQTGCTGNDDTATCL